MTYEMSAADLLEHLCYDSYLTFSSNSFVVYYLTSLHLGQGTGKRSLIQFIHGSPKNIGFLVSVIIFFIFLIWLSNQST